MREYKTTKKNSNVFMSIKEKKKLAGYGNVAKPGYVGYKCHKMNFWK